MSHRIISKPTDGHIEFVVDAKAELDELKHNPIGTCALVLEDKQLYILSGSGEWVAM